MPEHGLSSETYLAEQSLGAAAGKVENGFGFIADLRIADNRYGGAVFDIQQGTGCFNRYVAR